MAHQFREDGRHYNGGKVFFGYGYTAVGEPRLKMIRRWYRQGKQRGQTEDRFFVDGAHVATYEAALNALKLPPVYSLDDARALRKIGDEPADYRASIGFERLHSLHDKGAIEWGPPGRCARTEAGRAYLRNIGDDDVPDAERSEVTATGVEDGPGNTSQLLGGK